jgi:hypothetical protein
METLITLPFVAHTHSPLHLCDEGTFLPSQYPKKTLRPQKGEII